MFSQITNYLSILSKFAFSRLSQSIAIFRAVFQLRVDCRLSKTLDLEEDAITLSQLSKSPMKNAKLQSSSSSSPRTRISKGKVANASDLNVEKRNSDDQIKFAVSGRGRSSSSSKPRTVVNGGSSASGQARSSAVIQAEELLSSFESEFPGFVKSLVRSHVATCFWMGLPGKFCKNHLPDKDATITLEDEDGKQWGIKYIAYKTGLSAGWRQFSIAQKLLEGDVLVFHLVQTTKFKVYIIRANDLEEVDGALGLLNLDSHTKPSNTAQKDVLASDDKTNKKRSKSLPSSVIPIQKKKKKPVLLKPVPKPTTEQSENDSEEVGSEIVEDAQLSGSGIRFEEVKSFIDFRILVNRTTLDSNLSDNARKTYYNLCLSQNAFLHENITKDMNKWLILGAISEIVTIADALSDSSPATTCDELSVWEKSLRAFELLGMNVRFLIARVSRLGSAGERSFAESPAKTGVEEIEAQIAELREACDRLGGAIRSLGLGSKSSELEFPW